MKRNGFQKVHGTSGAFGPIDSSQIPAAALGPDPRRRAVQTRLPEVTDQSFFWLLPLQVAFLTCGILLWGWILLAPARRLPWRMPDLLPAWPCSLYDLAVLVFVSAVFILSFAQAGHWLADYLDADEAVEALFVGSGFHLGALCGWLSFRTLRQPPRGAAPTGVGPSLTAAAAAFLLILPLLGFVGLLWQWLLRLTGRPLVPQALVQMLGEIDRPEILLGLGVLAVILAPIAEELIFRAGLYRFLQSRMTSREAALVSSFLFALMHGNWFSFVPLWLLGIALCLLYQKTGTLKAPIFLHMIFNLNSLVFLLFGPDLTMAPA